MATKEQLAEALADAVHRYQELAYELRSLISATEKLCDESRLHDDLAMRRALVLDRIHYARGCLDDNADIDELTLDP